MLQALWLGVIHLVHSSVLWMLPPHKLPSMLLRVTLCRSMQQFPQLIHAQHLLACKGIRTFLCCTRCLHLACTTACQTTGMPGLPQMCMMPHRPHRVPPVDKNTLQGIASVIPTHPAMFFCRLCCWLSHAKVALAILLAFFPQTPEGEANF